jgi:AraC family transcriptional regulator of adaptative response/methylated-DNA-[protein]-cysteine methyltransferase
MMSIESLVETPDAGVDPRERLARIYSRDPAADGLFWYSVVTTGVFCRPTCPSRRAKPENIRFHDTLADARRTGFRPCQRCRPEEPSADERRRQLVEQACRLMESRTPPVSSRDLAAAVGVSPSYLHRLFRMTTGTTPGAYARARRDAAVREWLLERSRASADPERRQVAG